MQVHKKLIKMQSRAQKQDANDAAEALRKEFAQETEDLLLQAGAAKARSTNIVNTASTPKDPEALEDEVGYDAMQENCCNISRFKKIGLYVDFFANGKKENEQNGFNRNKKAERGVVVKKAI
ncbi:hypothetical protein Tco_1442816 [Tanacetum coccineum]